uniref:Thioesterase domain-containing protein n=1 Tax=Quercus lobata TaxID=97700 RepID=A0A7N2R9M5_QUELO
MEKPTATPWPKAEATSSNSSKTIANDVSAEYVSVITGFFKKLGVSHSNSIPDFCNTKYFYSHLIRDAIKPDQVLRGRITCLLTVTPVLANIYGSLHAGAIAAIAEMVSIACARSVVAEDKDIFLGDMSISYLSAAPIHGCPSHPPTRPTRPTCPYPTRYNPIRQLRWSDAGPELQNSTLAVRFRFPSFKTCATRPARRENDELRFQAFRRVFQHDLADFGN